MAISGSLNSNDDLNLVLQRRIMVIEDEMLKLDKHLNEFTTSCDTEFQKLLGNISSLNQSKKRLKAFDFKSLKNMPVKI